MPTRSNSDYLNYIKAQVVTQTATAVPQARNILRYEGSGQYLNAITQTSDMRYLTTGRLAPSRIAPRQVVLNRSNPKALSQVAFLGSAGPLGTLVNQPAARTAGTQGLVVLQTNLIQNANQNAGKSGNFLGNTPAITRA
jgi:hypothetical protein